MKRKITPSLLALIAISVSAASLQAASLTSTHQILSQQQGTNGFDVTLSLTLNNTGTTTLNGLTLNSMDSMMFNGSSPLALGSLPAGGALSTQWTLKLPAPAFPILMLDVADTDANGVVNHTPLISEVQ